MTVFTAGFWWNGGFWMDQGSQIPDYKHPDKVTFFTFALTQS